MTEKTQACLKIDPRAAAFLAGNAAESKKAFGTLILDVKSVTILADFFVITSGQTSTQVRAIAQAVEDNLAKQGLKPKSVEGKNEGRWVLLDYENLIVHIFQDKERSFYNLEQFWSHAKKIEQNEWFKELEES